MKNCYVLVCETTDNQEVFVFWYLNDARMNAKALANEVIDLYKAQGIEVWSNETPNGMGRRVIVPDGREFTWTIFKTTIR